MNNVFVGKCFWHLLIQVCIVCSSVLLLLGKGAAASEAVTPDQCCRCHSSVCEDAETKRFVHEPAQEKKCVVCHVKSSRRALSGQKKGIAEPEKIKWFARGGREDKVHWFEFSPDVAGTSVVLKAEAGSKDVLLEDIALPPLDKVDLLPMPQGKGDITNIRVLEVKRGVFLTARVAWQTDRLTDAQVFYEENGRTLSTALDRSWAQDHEILIMGLKADKTYNIVAVSRDVNGVKTMSEPVPVSTHEFFSETALENKGLQGPLKMEARYYQQEGRFFACFETSYPVSFRFGSREQPLRVAMAVGDVDTPVEHLEMVDSYALNITVCLDCHPQTKGVLSHPIDIKPKTGMVIPVNYKTIAGGRVSCMTCHEPHASQNEYRLVKPRRKDLCLGCHRNFR